jgi:hypothetical protein
MATTQVTPTAASAASTKAVTRTVFDLTTFDDLKLTKTVTLPAKPENLEQALAAVGNDQSKLMAVIYEGLVAEKLENERNDASGFMVIPDEGEPTELYTGTFADESKTKAINGAVLNLAKAAGYDKSLPIEKKNELKQQARDFIRGNPAMLKFIAG